MEENISGPAYDFCSQMEGFCTVALMSVTDIQLLAIWFDPWWGYMI